MHFSKIPGKRSSSGSPRSSARPGAGSRSPRSPSRGTSPGQPRRGGRGRRSSGSYRFMKRSPAWLTRRAPSPRSASEMRKRFTSRWKSTVGWNWTYSALRISAPILLAMASPSPVAQAGLEVCRKRLPTPPVASTDGRREECLHPRGGRVPEVRADHARLPVALLRVGGVVRVGDQVDGRVRREGADPRVSADGGQERRLDGLARRVLGVVDPPQASAPPPG